MRILNFGSLNIDYVYRVDTFLKPGETKAAKSRAVFAGGKGLNQSLAMAKAGLPVYHAGKVGVEGVFLINTLKQGGVNTSLIGRSQESSGHTVIQVDDQGRNCILLFGGANQDIDQVYVDEVLSSFGTGDFLVLQNEISLVPYIIKQAKSQGLTIIFNPSPYIKEILSYPLECIDVFILNEIEAEGFTGLSDPEQALTALTARFSHAHIVLTLGEKGALWGCGSEVASQKAYPVKAVDTTAAGDTFLGYFVAGLVEGLPVSDTLDLASRAASICVSRPGAADSIPSRQELR